jgi:hypothetical protein
MDIYIITILNILDDVSVHFRTCAFILVATDDLFQLYLFLNFVSVIVTSSVT